MISIDDEILENFKTDLEIIINESIKRLYENDSKSDEDIDVAIITSKVKVQLCNASNEITNEIEKIPVIEYEAKYKIPEEVKQKGKETTEYYICIEDDEVVSKKRKKAQLEIFEEKENDNKTCTLGKTKYQDIVNCKNRINNSCKNCKHLN